MAQINTNTTYDSYFWVRWSQGTQDVANNKTFISWSCGVYCGHSFYSNAIKMSAFSINGTQVYAGGTYSNYSKGDHTIASGNMWIGHDQDGTKTFSISAFTGWLYANYNYSAAASDHALTQIPRGAKITGAVDFTDTDNPTITYSNPAGNSVTYLEACISLTGARDDINYRSVPKTGNSYTFSLTDAERTILRNNTPGTSRTVYFYLRTRIGSSTFYSAPAKTFTVTENSATKPSVRMEINLNNGGLPSTFDDMYIQGVSRVDVTLSADGKYGADIDRYYATIDGKTYYSHSFTSDVIQNIDDVDIVGYAEDSRGFTGEASESINVTEYSKPSVTVIAYRCNSSGEEDPEGAYMKVGFTATITSLDGKTSAQYIIDYGGSRISGTGTSYISEPIKCDVSRVWPVEVRVSDGIATTTKAAVIPIAFTLMDFYSTGRGVALGKVATRDGFDCAMTAYFTGGVYVGEKSLADYIKSVVNG